MTGGGTAATQAAGLGRLVGAAFESFARQRFGEVAVESLWHSGQLRKAGERFDTWNHRHIHSRLLHALTEAKVSRIVVEELRHAVVCSEFHLLAEVGEIGLQIGRFLMLLRIAGHAIAEINISFNGRPIEKCSSIESIDLFLQFGGVCIAAPRGHKHLFVARLVAAQQQEVLDAQKLEVDEHILRLLLCEALTENVWHSRNAIFVLYGSGHRHRARAATQGRAAERAVGLFGIDILRMVRRDIDIFRVELA